MAKNYISSFIWLGAALSFTVAAEQNQELPSSSWKSIFVVDDNTVWVGSGEGKVAVSENAGETWQVSTPGGRSANLDIRQIVAYDNRHAFLLSSGRGERSRLMRTRNAGYSWRQLYRANGDEYLHCFDIIPDGESWVLGEAILDDWHVVRSSNTNHWISSRSGFAERSLMGESASDDGNCVTFANNFWAMGTKDAEYARLVYKSARALRFQVVNTPLTGGAGNGIHVVYPLGNNDILIAGGAEQGPPEFYRYTNGNFTELNSPPLEGPLIQMVVTGSWTLVGNTNGVYRSDNFGDSWAQVSASGVKGLSCSETGACWAITIDHEVVKLPEL